MAVAATTPILGELDRPTGRSTLELIDDHFPLVLVRCAGPIDARQVLGMIRFFDDMGVRAAREGRTLVTICDAREACRPTPLVREMLADWMRDRPLDRHGLDMHTFVVVGSPLIRGVIASLKWATGRGTGIEAVGSLELAARGACQALREANQAVPEILAEACP